MLLLKKEKEFEHRCSQVFNYREWPEVSVVVALINQRFRSLQLSAGASGARDTGPGALPGSHLNCRLITAECKGEAKRNGEREGKKFRENYCKSFQFPFSGLGSLQLVSQFVVVDNSWGDGIGQIIRGNN